MKDCLELLFSTLDELGEARLRRFKTYLSEMSVDGFKPIPRGQLETTDTTDVGVKMKETYGEVRSVELTLHILRKMNLIDLAGKLERNAAAASAPGKENEDAILKEVRKKHKKKMIEKFEIIQECVEERKNKALLNQIYTELYITEGESEGVNTQHEVRRSKMQTKFKRNESKINCNNVFKSLIDNEKIRIVMTTGIAGIGKTICVQKFILDWAEGRANQEIDFIFALPFRRLNLIQNDKNCLHNLLLDFHPAIKEVTNTNIFNDLQIILIFDGLDESKLSLNFKENMEIDDPLKIVSVNVLITNLITGNLLPNALIWITSRPAAVKVIPTTYIDRWTEVHGFDEQQRAEYFRKKIKNEAEANRAITHIKKSKSLFIMCHIPVFCWILATVFLNMVNHSSGLNLPQTLTEVYIHFLITESQRKKQKYADGFERDRHRLLKHNREIILKLSKLAYKELIKGNILFYEDNLEECGIDIKEPSLYSGICTEFFKIESNENECDSLNRTIFCFVHLSIQEFLAAFFMFYTYVNKSKEALNLFTHQADEATGITMVGPTSRRRESSSKMMLTRLSRLFRGCLIAHSEDTKEPEYDQLSMSDFLRIAVDRAIEQNDGHLDLFLRFLLGIALESNQRLLQVLLTKTESSSDSIKQITQYIKSILSKDNISIERCMNLLLCLLEMKENSLLQEIQQYMNQGKELSPAQSSILAYILLVSEDVLEEFELTKYKTTSEGRKRLLVVLRICRKAQLAGCGLREDSCEVMASSLQSENSLLKILDLSSNPLESSGVILLSTGLRHTNCRLEILRLADCKLTSEACQPLAMVLQSKGSHLKKLDLTSNDLRDSGVKNLCAALEHKSWKLEVLMLSGCLISYKGCKVIASVLSTNSHLKELDLSYNYPGSAGEQMLSKLSSGRQKVNVENCSEVRMKKGKKKYGCELTLDLNTAHMFVYVNEKMKMARYVEEKQPYPDHPSRFDCDRQVLCTEPLCGRCYWEVECKGFCVVGVADQNLARDGNSALGYSKYSWCLECNSNNLTIMHNKMSLDAHTTLSENNRIGVYLDWKAGILSFYILLSERMEHLHTSYCTFTEPLYAAFGVCRENASISLCQI